MTEPNDAPSWSERFPALGRLGATLRRRRIPYVAQLTSVDCGAACIARWSAGLSVCALTNNSAGGTASPLSLRHTCIA